MTGRYDRDSETLHRSRDLVHRLVDSATRLAHPLEFMDEYFTAWAVLQVDVDGALLLVFNDFVAIDVTFGLEDLGNTTAHLVVEAHNALGAVSRSVADSGQHVCDWITDRHRVLPFLAF